jgi:thioredoxin-like negative regulator of GroEL
MNKVIELTEDNLSNHIWDPKVIVVYSSGMCGMCKTLKPKLYNVNEQYKVVIVDSEKHFKSNMFYPRELLWFPTISYFEEGVYIKDILKTEIEEGLWN